MRVRREGKDIDVALGLGAVLLLILICGFYVTGEFALVAVDRSRTEADAEQGHRRAASTLRALKELSFHLSGAQLGITVTSLLIGFVLEPTVGDALRPAVEAIGIPPSSSLEITLTLALLLTTAVQMVLGELVPKNLAIAHPVGTAYAVAGALRMANALFRPVIVFLNASANVTVRLLGIEPKEELIPVRSRRELQQLIHESGARGALGEEEFNLLARSISFGDKTAADALVPRFSIKALSRQATLSDLAGLALETGHSRFPVYGRDLDDIIGVAHVKDSYRIPLEQRSRTEVAEIARTPMVVPESRRLGELLVDMRRERQHIAIVVDEYGGTAGIATLEDLLEEIVGEIEDEYDPGRPAMLTPAFPAGGRVVSGLLHPEELRDQTGFSMPEGGYETLAGFLLSLFDRIPKPGDNTFFEGWSFEIVAMEGKRIAQVLMVPPSTRGEGGA